MSDDSRISIRGALLGVVFWNVFWVVMLSKYPDWALCHPRRLFGIIVFALTIILGNGFAIIAPFVTGAVMHGIGRIFK